MEPKDRPRIVTLDRRSFLRITGYAALSLPLAACGTSEVDGAIDPGPGGGTGTPPRPPGMPAPEELAFNPLAVPHDPMRFPSASLAGEMTASSLMLAGYFADLEPKTLRVWRPTADAGRVLLAHESLVLPDDHGYVKQALTGLDAGAWYSYAFFDGVGGDFSSRSHVSQVRTALADDSLEPLTVAISACNGGKADPDQPTPAPFSYPALETTAREEYDLFIHLGDMAYMDDVFNAGGSRAQYANAWQWYLRSHGMRNAYARAGLYSTWDDHEVADNGKLDPWSMDADDVQRIRNAKEAYYRAMPIDATTADDPLWRTFRWGKVAEFIMLDSRYERNPPSSGEYLSRTQMDFLKERLKASPCHFKVVANSVPITRMPFPWTVVKNDRWEGYPAARQELMEHINNESIENVWFLTGDLHLSFASRVEPEGDDLFSRSREIAITGGNSAFVGPTADHFDYMSAQPRACTLTFDPFRNSVFVRFLDPDTGEELWSSELAQ